MLSELQQTREDIRVTKAKLKEAEKTGRSEAYVISLQNLLISHQNLLVKLQEKENILLAQSVSTPANSPRYPQSVFIFGDVSSGVFQPVGTCFAITNELLLTCQHNMEGRRCVNYAFALTCERRDQVITCPRGYFEAKVLRYNVEMDYALIESTVKKDLIPIPISIGPVESDLDIKAFHMPIDDFNDTEKDDSLAVDTKWFKSTLPTTHHMKCTGGLFSGSSGGPFILRNGTAIGFHCESISSKPEVDIIGKSVEDAVEIISDTLNSHTHNHASFCHALLIGSCKKLVDALKEFGVHD